jgi:hypothetical protein
MERVLGILTTADLEPACASCGEPAVAECANCLAPLCDDVDCRHRNVEVGESFCQDREACAARYGAGGYARSAL